MSSLSLPPDELIKARILVGMTHGDNSVTIFFYNLRVHLRASDITIPIKACDFPGMVLVTSIPCHSQKHLCSDS